MALFGLAFASETTAELEKQTADLYAQLTPEQRAQYDKEKAARTQKSSASLQPLHPDLRKEVQQSTGLKQTGSSLSTSSILATKNKVVGEIRSLRRDLARATNSLNAITTETLQPISSFMGSTVGTATGVLRDPIGTVYRLPNTLESALRRVSPSLADKYNTTAEKLSFEKVIELPKNAIGSLYHAMETIDKAVAVPINFVLDLYYGLADILDEIEALIMDLFQSIQEFAMNIIDSIFPGLMDFINELSSFLNKIGGIVTIFAGANQFTAITNSALFSLNSFNSAFQNPLDLAVAYLPNEAGQALYVLRNPQALINQFLPPELSQYFATISKVTGSGFNGNMGYGFLSALEGFRGGVLTSILRDFNAQYDILGPILSAGNSSQQVSYDTAPLLKEIDGEKYWIDYTGNVIPVNPKQRFLVPKDPSKPILDNPIYDPNA